MFNIPIYKPETPGKEIVFDKPGIPNPAWNEEAKAFGGAKAKFKGSFQYTANEAGVVIHDLKAKGCYVQHIRSGTFTANSSIRAYYNDALIITANVVMSADAPYSSSEIFIRDGMWVAQATDPAIEADSMDVPVTSVYSRALEKDEPYITDLILGTSGASSGEYRVWIYE